MAERLFFITKNLFKTYKCPERIKQRFRSTHSSFTNRFGQFVMYSAAFYNWEDQGVSDNEIKSTIQEFTYTSKLFFDQRNKKLTSHDCPLKRNSLLKDEWEAVLVQDDYQVWRKKLEKSGLYRYKVFGTFHDIPAKTFFNVQMDTEYRKKWDSLIVKLNILDQEKRNEPLNFRSSLNEIDFIDTGNEVLQWVMKYPYPMYSREYCYIRRAIVCNKENLIVLISKSCDHPKCKEQSERSSVRVLDYESQMVIRPHSTFDENGFDYLLTYFDDPRAYVPVTAYNWIASSGLPGFVESLHKAALELNERINSDDQADGLKRTGDDPYRLQSDRRTAGQEKSDGKLADKTNSKKFNSSSPASPAASSNYAPNLAKPNLTGNC